MTKKRIRQMNAALLRRLSLRPAAEYLAGREETAAQLVGEGYFQRFAPLMDRWLCCARVLDLCREDLERLDGPEPEEGWMGELASELVRLGRSIEEADDLPPLPAPPAWTESKQRHREALKKLALGQKSRGQSWQQTMW